MAVVVKVEWLTNEEHVILEAVKHLFLVRIEEIVLQQRQEFIFVKVQFGGIGDDLLVTLPTLFVCLLDGLSRERIEVRTKGVVV